MDRARAVAHRPVDGPGPLVAIGVTMPPWPGDDEAIVVPGHRPAA